MKKLILFIVSFCFINVFAANDFSLQCEYKTSDTTYRVIIPLKDNGIDYTSDGKILISKSNSSTGSYTDPEEINDLGYYLGTDQSLTQYGVSSVSVSFYMHSTYMENFALELKNAPIKYCPVLVFNDNNEPVLFGSYFLNEYFEETVEYGTPNVNNAKAGFEKVLRGDVTSLDKNINVLNFYDSLHLKSDIYYSSKSTIQNVNISGGKNESGIDWSASTCQEYDFLLKQLQEAIAGKDGNGGVCSANSLNKMQSTGSLYDLENNFDKSVLEPECVNYVFGGGGTSYISTIVDAQMYYNSFINDTDKAYSLKCLSMQSRYLAGLTLLTTYTPHSDNLDAKGCTLIGDDVLDFIDELFDVFKIISTAVCIFLCIMDAYKVIFSKTVDMSKFQSLVVKRIIALVVIFLLPVFISVVSDYINERYMKSKGDICLNVIGA